MALAYAFLLPSLQTCTRAIIFWNHSISLVDHVPHEKLAMPQLLFTSQKEMIE